MLRSPLRSLVSRLQPSSSLGLVLLVVVTVLVGCTTQRDGRFYRAYHNTTSRFNGFHFARLAMEEADGT